MAPSKRFNVGVVRRVMNSVSERDVRLEIARYVAFLQGAPQVGQNVLKSGDILRLAPHRRLRRRDSLERDPAQIHLVEVATTERADPGASAFGANDKPVVFEKAKRLADRRSADAKALGDFFFNNARFRPDPSKYDIGLEHFCEPSGHKRQPEILRHGLLRHS